MRDMLAAARDYHMRGYSPWPIAPASKRPLNFPVGKNGRTWGGRNHEPLGCGRGAACWCKSERDDLRGAFGGQRPPDLALVVREGHAVLDLDPKNNPKLTALFNELEAFTRVARTPSGGIHAYLQTDGKAPIEHPALGVDLQGYGSLVIAPPSVGREFINELPEAKIENAGEWSRAFLSKYGIENRPPVEFIAEDDRMIPEHARNLTLAALAGLLRKVGIAPNIVRAMIRGAASDPISIAVPMDRDEADAIALHMQDRRSEPFEIGGLTITTVTSDEEIAALLWLVAGVIPAEGITLLYGLPAQGKSWTALSMAVAVVRGVDWLSGPTVRAKVLYVDWERRGMMFRRRLKALCSNERVSIDYAEARGSLAEMVPQITELVRARGYEFVIIDSLSIAMMGADMMAANEVIPAMFALHDIGVPIMCLDHQKKLYENENPWAAGAYGSIFKEAVASMVWQAGKIDPRTRTEGYMDFKLHHRKNNFDLAPGDIWIRLTFNEGDETVTMDRIESGDVTPERAVLEAVSNRHPEPVSLTEIRAITGLKRETARDAARKLETDGLIRLVERGNTRGESNTYALVGDGDAAGGV